MSRKLARLLGWSSARSEESYPALGEDVGLVTQTGFTVLLCCRTALPARFTEIFSTQQDGQAVLPVKVYTRDPATDDVQPLGALVIDGISPAPAGTPEIEVTIVVDPSGRVRASSKEAGSGHSKEAVLGRVAVTHQE